MTAISNKGEQTYSITQEACQSMLDKNGGVCDQCGGKLEPIETVDNANNPTFWGGCNVCNKFHWGTPAEVYKAAVILVDESFYVAYHHMDKPDKESKPGRYKYWRESQIAGACRTIQKVQHAIQKAKGLHP